MTFVISSNTNSVIPEYLPCAFSQAVGLSTSHMFCVKGRNLFPLTRLLQLLHLNKLISFCVAAGPAQQHPCCSRQPGAPPAVPGSLPVSGAERGAAPANAVFHPAWKTNSCSQSCTCQRLCAPGLSSTSQQRLEEPSPAPFAFPSHSVPSFFTVEGGKTEERSHIDIRSHQLSVKNR